jgi:hypothetical protein
MSVQGIIQILNIWQKLLADSKHTWLTFSNL